MMGRLLLFLFVLCEFSVRGVPIETPELDERNEFAIQSPEDWGYRTFKGKNGLIGVLWPKGTSFNSTDTAIFVFVQDSKEKLPKKPDNINLFTEKCPKAKFKFSKMTKRKRDETLSIAEEYFSGRCGRTMILFKEVIDNYTIIVFLASARYVSKKHLSDTKKVVANYRKEIEKYIKNSAIEDENDD
ncbi:MAG: hypothetical protein LBB21_07050 [Holosporaceae bacterium]|jgi:hypothetical protein|nr:hypothetical protein [Holosporaceae bacterium]